MATAYLRFRLGINKNTDVSSVSGAEAFLYAEEFIKKWTYKVIAQTRSDGSIPFKKPFQYEFSGTFNVLLQSNEHKMDSYRYSIEQMNESLKVTWILSFNGKERYRVKGRFFDHSIESGRSPRDGGGDSLFDTYSINFTSAVTTFKEEKARLRIQQISGGTGWYLVKQPETFGDLMKRIFITPSKIDWDIMRENNAHLGNVQMMTLLQVGQVVIVALERNNRKAIRMKAEAQKAQAAWRNAQMFGSVEPAHLMIVDLLLNGHKLHTVEPKTLTESVFGYIDAGKPFVDGSIEFKKSLYEQANKAYEKVKDAAKPELSKVTTIEGMTKRGASAAGQNASRAYKLMDGSTLAQKLLAWDTGIQGDSVRSYIRQEARVRHADFQKGIANYAERLEEVSKYSKWLKRGGYVGMAVDIGMSGYKAFDAYQHGDSKKAIEEIGQGAGGLIGGAAGGWAGGLVGSAVVTGAILVLGVGTGGVGLVVVGLFVAGSAYAGGEAFKAGAKIITDEINDGSSQ
jgi:hypothetical protein